MELQSIRVKIYDKFKCKADKCKHTCCKGWEVEIDPYTYELYKKMNGELGDMIRSKIVCSDDSYFFKMTEDNKCPMLDDKGLCQIITEKGDDELCDICNNHPRFYETVNDVELLGIGLSCEKTCELLDREDKLKFIATFLDVKDGNATLVEKTVDLSGVFELLGLDKYNDEDEDIDVQYYVNYPSTEYDKELFEISIDFYNDTEPIDDKWKEEIVYIKNRIKNASEEEIKRFESISLRDNFYNKIYQLILFRQLDQMEKYGFAQVVGYALMATEFVKLWDLFDGRDLEHVRRWSEQMEYNEENIKHLITG